MPRPISFVRLPQVPLSDIITHMNNPRVAEHLPLLNAAWAEPEARAFVSAKEACWARDGLGHWAFLFEGRYVGWGGFQKEGDDWDFGLVLVPDRFGLGPRIARQALDFARSDARLEKVTFLLPPSRRHLSALRRLGARYVGEVTYEGELFRKFSVQTV